jgi:hypothetical protein
VNDSRPTRRPRSGSRRDAPDPGALARLTAARDHLDAELAAARLREDELLAEYVTIETAAAGVITRRDTALAELDRKAQAVRDEADDELAAVEARRGEVLMHLSRRRSAEELHVLVGLPVRRIRKVLQLRRQPAEGAPAVAQPVAQPVTTDSPDRAAAAPVAVLAEPTAAPRPGGENARPPVPASFAGQQCVPPAPVTGNRSEAVAAEHQ